MAAPPVPEQAVAVVRGPAPPGRPGVSRPWHVADLLDLPEDGRYEIVDGGLLSMPPPTALHQWLVRQLFRQLDPQTPPGWELGFDVGIALLRRPEDTDYRVPDLAVAPSGPRPDRRDLATVARQLALAIEVTVTSTTTDRVLKPVDYAEAGIRWFWRLEAEPFVLISHELRGDSYVEVLRADRGIVAVPGPFPLTVDLDALRG